MDEGTREAALIRTRLVFFFSHLIASEDFAVSGDDDFTRAVDAHLPLQFEEILCPAIVYVHQLALTHTQKETSQSCSVFIISFSSCAH